jgi:hypothetical protein
MRAVAALACASCAERGVTYVDWPPESAGASAAIVAIHTPEVMRVFAYDLEPRPGAIRPDIELDEEMAQATHLEAVIYQRSLDALFLPGGEILLVPGGIPLPRGPAFSRDLIDGAWSSGPRSPELDAFTIADTRPDGCAGLEAEVLRLPTEIVLEDLVIDEAGTLYALLEGTAGIIRIAGGAGTPLEVSPAADVSSGTFSRGRLWIASSTGAVWSGVVVGDRIDLEREPIDVPAHARWMIDNPYGPRPLLVTNAGALFDLSTTSTVFVLDASDQTDEGALIYTDAIYFTTVRSGIIGRYDGSTVTPIPIPLDQTGGALALVPGLGLLAGTPFGMIFRVEGAELELLDEFGVDANNIVAFEDGFVVGSDHGQMYRWVDSLGFCAIPTGGVEDLEIGLAYGGGAVFGPNSNIDRSKAGDQTPITFVRPGP